MRVAKIELENLKALVGKHEFSMNGKSFFVIAGNGQGKTTLGRLVMDILTKNLPTQPVTEGEKQGYVEVTLDNGDKIYYRFNETGKPQLEIISANGGKFSNITDLFKTMAGNGMNFNIDEFLKMQPKPRRAMLEKMAGVDFTEINTREKNAETDRTGINARLKDAKAKVVPFDEKVIEQPRVDASSLSEKLSMMEKHNVTFDNSEKELSNLNAEASELEKQIQELAAKLNATNERIRLGSEWISANKKYSDTDIAEVKNSISNADSFNRSIDAAITAKKDFEFAQELEQKSTDAEALVKAIRHEKDDLIKKAQLPAEGLTFSPDGETLLLDGLPFEDAQIATSRKMIAAIQIAEKMLGTIRFLHLDASILDKENAEKLLKWAESRDLQLALERSLWEGGELMFEVYEPNEA